MENEAWDRTMDDGIIEIAAIDVVQEVGDGLRRRIREQRDIDIAEVGVEASNLSRRALAPQHYRRQK